MDEKLEKAIQVVNYMTTLTTQRKVEFEEFKQHCVFYKDGATFSVNNQLIGVVHSLISKGLTESIIIDDNQIPVKIENLSKFLDEILDIYGTATNKYYSAYVALRSKRKVEDLVKLL